MDETRWTFLTRSQVMDAMAYDFQQYGSQPDLFAALVQQMPGMDCRMDREEDRLFFRISRDDRPALQIREEKMGFFLVHLMESLPLSLSTLAGMSRLVFQTAVVCGDSSGRRGVWIEHGMDRFTCSHCGRCCRKLSYTRDCTRDDILRWENAGRTDILDRIKGSESDGYEIWFNPLTGSFFDVCPWLSREGSRQFCTIHEIKPDTCREYPFTPKHAAMTGCRGRFSA